MKWYNYIKENSDSEKYRADCQLVSAVNAYMHLTDDKIKQDSNFYRDLAELAGCCWGSCIDITKVWKKLGIWEDKRYTYHDLIFGGVLKSKVFLEASIWHKRYGFHSVAIVDYCKKVDAVRITNFKYETSMDGWMFLEDLKPHLTLNPNKDKPEWHFRSFKTINQV